MNRTLALGALLALGGLAVVFAPGLGTGLSLTYGAVLLVGALALVSGLGTVRRRLAADRETATVPNVESAPVHPVPGDEFDATLAAISPRRDRENDAARAEIRARLEAAALAVLARDGHPREVGRDMLDSGAWTDDPVAAAFFAVDPVESPGDESFGARLRSSVGGSYSFDSRARRAAYAIAERAGVGEPAPDDDTRGRDDRGGAPSDAHDADGNPAPTGTGTDPENEGDSPVASTRGGTADG